MDEYEDYASVGYEISDIELKRRELLAAACHDQEQRPTNSVERRRNASRPVVDSGLRGWNSEEGREEDRFEVREGAEEDLLFKLGAAADGLHAQDETSCQQREMMRAGTSNHPPGAVNVSSLISRLISIPPSSSASFSIPSQATSSKSAPQRNSNSKPHQGKGRKQPVSLLYPSSSPVRDISGSSRGRSSHTPNPNPHSSTMNQLFASHPASVLVKNEASTSVEPPTSSSSMLGNPLQQLLGGGGGGGGGGRGGAPRGGHRGGAGFSSLLYKKPRLSHESIQNTLSPPIVPLSKGQGEQPQANVSAAGDVQAFMRAQEERHRSLLSILPRQSLISEPGPKGFGALGRCLKRPGSDEVGPVIRSITPSGASLSTRLQKLLEMQAAHQDRLDRLHATSGLSSSLIKNHPALSTASIAPLESEGGAGAGAGMARQQASELNQDCFLNLAMISGSGSIEGHLFKLRARNRNGDQVTVVMTMKMATALKLQEGAAEFTVHRPWGEIGGGRGGEALVLLVHAATPNWVI